ncbi:MAG: hypothetical protein QOF53_2438 [Nocardioidaceae bacterium]|nr:hypothetical protein [Nocardioidaceae bacterium]
MPSVTKISAPITPVPVAQSFRFVIGVDTHAATHSLRRPRLDRRPAGRADVPDDHRRPRPGARLDRSPHQR